MSTIALSCPGCGKRYELSASLAGKKARCKACSHEFSIPVPRQVAAVVKPAPSNRSSPRPSAPKASQAPPPSLDREQPSFNPYEDLDTDVGSRRSAAYDEEETPLPSRGGGVRTPAAVPKKKRKKSRSSSSFENWWAFIPLGGLAVALLVVIAALAVKSFAVGALVILVCVGLLVGAIGGIWGWVNAFRENILCGFLYLLPIYPLYYLVTRWDEMKRPFATSCAGTFIYPVLPLILVLSGIVTLDQLGLAGNPFPSGAGGNFGGAPGGFQGPGIPFNGPMGALDAMSRVDDLRRAQEAQADAIRTRLGDRGLTIRVHGVPMDNHGKVSAALTEAVGGFYLPGPDSTSIAIGELFEAVGAVDRDPNEIAKEIRFGRVNSVNRRVIDVTLSPEFVASLPVSQPAAVAAPSAPQPAAVAIPAGADDVTKALLQIGSPEVFQRGDGVRTLLNTPPNDRRDEVVATVVPLLGNPDGFYVIELMKVLERWNTPQAIEGIVSQTRNSQFNVRWAALETLGRIKEPSTIEAIVACLKEDGFKARPALQEFGPAAEPALINALSSPEPEVRKAACELLRDHGGKATLEAMRSLPADNDPFVRGAANDAMKSIIDRVGPLPVEPAAPKRKRSRL